MTQPPANAFGRVIHPCKPWAAGDPCRVFHEALEGVIRAFDGDSTSTSNLVHGITAEIRESLGRSDAKFTELEMRLKGLLSANVPDYRDHVRTRLAVRTELIVKQISSFLPPPGATVIDWGCGNGAVGAQISASHNVTLVDIDDLRTTGFGQPFFIYDEVQPISSLPTRVDSLLLLTVLHHAKDPVRTISHAIETQPARIIVIESVPDLPDTFFDSCSGERSDLAFQYCGFVDWFYNRVICTNVQMTYNYQYVNEWIAIFRRIGYELVDQIPLGIDQPLVPEWHVLMVFEREATRA